LNTELLAEMAAVRARPARRWVGRRDKLRHDRHCPAERGVVEYGEILAHRMVGRFGRKAIAARHSALAVGVCLDHAGVDDEAIAAQTSAMQRQTFVSNTWRSKLRSRKQLCRFFEKVEWSGTAASSPTWQNQR
jgi:hypothetical protein